MFNAPLSARRADELIRALDLPPAARVVDFGCGDGAFLRRIAAQTAIVGIGIDLDATLIEQATGAARMDASGGKLHFIAADCETTLSTLELVDAVVCIGSEFTLGGYQPLLRKARSKLLESGRLLVGTVYWKQPPAADYLALMNGENPHADLLKTVQIARDEGYLPLEVQRSTDDEWDSFESRHARKRYLTAIEQQQAGLRDRAWIWQRGYLEWGMQTMGFCFLVLQKSDWE